MAYKKIENQATGQKADMIWKFDEGMHKVFEGLFTGTIHNTGTEKNSSLHMFTTLDGKSTVGIWGKSVLDSNIANFKQGDKVRITYLGKAKSNTPGRFYDNFEFEVDVPEGEDRPF